MAIDERLVRKGRGEPRDGLAQQGRAHVELAKKHGVALAENGWSEEDTLALESGVKTLESTMAVQAEGRISASIAAEAESSGIDGAKGFVRKLRNALPRAIREAGAPGIEMATFAAGETLGRVTPRISAYLTRIRPAVEKLDDHLVKHFNNKKATDVLDVVKAQLDGADAKQEVTLASLPADTLSIYETKGLVLEKIEDMNRAGRSAFDGQAVMIGLFNKDILVRARSERAKKKGELKAASDKKPEGPKAGDVDKKDEPKAAGEAG